MRGAVHLHLSGCASICAKARLLIRKGYDPEAMVYAWRSATLCFTPMPLRHWAGLTVEEGAYQSARFRRYRPRDASETVVLASHTANSAAEVVA